MADHKARNIPYRRKREGRTDYKKRLHLLLSSKARLTVRMSNSSVSSQIIVFEPKGDKVIAQAHSSALRKLGWKYSLKNYSAAYLVGLLLAKNAKSAGVGSELILDTGFATPRKGGKLYALLKGALDGGLSINHGSAEIFPKEEKISGKVLVDFAVKLQADSKELFAKRYSGILSQGADPTKMVEAFESVKKAISG